MIKAGGWRDPPRLPTKLYRDRRVLPPNHELQVPFIDPVAHRPLYSLKLSSSIALGKLKGVGNMQESPIFSSLLEKKDNEERKYVYTLLDRLLSYLAVYPQASRQNICPPLAVHQ